MRTFSLGAGAYVVKYSAASETAVIDDSSAVAVGNLVNKVREVAQNADTINNVKAGDKIVLNTTSLKLAKYGAGVVNSDTVGNISDLNTSAGTGDVFVLKDGTNYFLVYEASATGAAASVGTGAEVIKLVGFTENNTINVEGDTTIVIV